MLFDLFRFYNCCFCFGSIRLVSFSVAWFGLLFALCRTHALHFTETLLHNGHDGWSERVKQTRLKIYGTNTKPQLQHNAISFYRVFIGSKKTDFYSEYLYLLAFIDAEPSIRRIVQWARNMWSIKGNIVCCIRVRHGTLADSMGGITAVFFLLYRAIKQFCRWKNMW